MEFLFMLAVVFTLAVAGLIVYFAGSETVGRVLMLIAGAILAVGVGIAFYLFLTGLAKVIGATRPLPPPAPKHLTQQFTIHQAPQPPALVGPNGTRWPVPKHEGETALDYWRRLEQVALERPGWRLDVPQIKGRT